MEKIMTTSINNIKYLSFFIIRAILISVICFLILIGIILCIYFGDLLLNVNNQKSPLFNGYVIVSQSMVPTININDAIIVKRQDDDKYEIGDIISFKSKDVNYNGLTVTHRIVDKVKVNSTNSVYTTKGDNNALADNTGVSTDSIYGKVLFIIPNVGIIQSFFSKPSNIFMLIIIPSLLILLLELRKIYKFAYRKVEV